MADREKGQSQHKGHAATVMEQISRARTHYETRRDRRPRQTWTGSGWRRKAT